MPAANEPAVEIERMQELATSFGNRMRELMVEAAAHGVLLKTEPVNKEAVNSDETTDDSLVTHHTVFVLPMLSVPTPPGYPSDVVRATIIYPRT